jgi:uncharacterized membrane protein (UPF0127 family)
VLRRSRGAFLVIALILTLASCGDEPPPYKLERVRLRVKDKIIVAECARTPREQARGLMYRRSLGKNDGMLFIYDSPRYLSFWMKNTRIPLSIAFLDGKGKIVRIEHMRPYDSTTLHPSLQPVRYALEMNQGWFEKNGVGVGDVIEIPNSKSQIPK